MAYDQRIKELEAERDVLIEALTLAIEVAEDMLGQYGFYEDGKQSYFNTKWHWSVDIAKAKEALSKVEVK